MLSEETAVGEYPVEAVRVMDRIARETEPGLPYDRWVFNRVARDPDDVASSVARAAVGSTYTLDLAAIVVPTRSGRTARLRLRPPAADAGARRSHRASRRSAGSTCCSASSAKSPEWTGLTALLDECAEVATRDRRRQVG